MNMNKAEQVVYLYFYVNGSVSKSQVLLLPRGTSHAKIICTGSSGNPSIEANFTLWGPQVVERQLDHFQETSKHVMKLI